MDYGYHSIALWLLPKVSIEGKYKQLGRITPYGEGVGDFYLFFGLEIDVIVD